MTPIILLENVHKIFRPGTDIQVPALRGVDLEVEAGELVAIMGPSGSGKSSLMYIVGCLDRPTRGRYLLDGQEVGVDDDRLARIRNQRIGFVFQSFNLLPRLTALENAELPLIYRGLGAALRRSRAQEALEAVGLGDRMTHTPLEMSGGEQQRVAIARALVGEPSIILADEPTGNLDSRAGAQVMEIFGRLNDQGITVVFVTHDESVGRHARRLIRLRDGQLTQDRRQEPVSGGEGRP